MVGKAGEGDHGATALEEGFAEAAAPYRRFAVKQIAGKIASRIVCELRTGQQVVRGERFGMIKFGSRTELSLAKDQAEALCRVGDRVRGGATEIARFLASGVAAPAENRDP